MDSLEPLGCLVSTFIFAIVVIVLIAMFNGTPWGRALINGWDYTVQKVDDSTSYDTMKRVEDSCRAMMSSYKSDFLTYQQYKDSTNPEKQAWAEQARTRANRTAASYNEYILKNSYVWRGNIPKDISESLSYL